VIEPTLWQNDATPSQHFAPQASKTPLHEMLAGIAAAISCRRASPEKLLAPVLARHVSAPDLLDNVACPPSKARYARHLLDGGDNHCVLAIVWMPGQMSPVHGHHTWCALGVHRGSLSETVFKPGDGGLRLLRSRQLREGALSCAPAGGSIHRIANLGTDIAISIHVYGVPFDRLGHGVNDVRSD